MKAYLFPGQASQFVGMGKNLYDSSIQARKMFQQANKILNIDLSRYMFEGPEEILTQTTIAQPAIFLYSIIAITIATNFEPAAVAGHSLGEIAALVASKVITFKDGLHLIAVRSKAMKESCKNHPGTMVAVLGLENQVVEDICRQFSQNIVTPANYNCPGQIVISGSILGIQQVSQACIKAGARKISPLKVEGAFHSPLMADAQSTLALALEHIEFRKGICPVYQNVTGLPTTDPKIIKRQLIEQLVAPVYWTQTIDNMAKNGIVECITCEPGTVLQKLVKRINPQLLVSRLI